jgi:hypothetical protein
VKKLLPLLFESLGFISGLFIISITMSLLSSGAGLTLLIALLVLYTWFGRHNEDGLYRLFKDTHQSNLDDIERQELEDHNLGEYES